ncbi:hypothetical protein CANCADRAFT_97525 [Tortispora caseinolytica NRRL Y-17796]|uniref:Translation initiation factor eIF2B subunit gamma n=1 Tax=Tortispora caseinolytica NRRL Y-17796 TaxID=767744 RepID=A0A1E4TDQ0_9ASCO|nr:hypothetical protein CANCADRAFT_97525 [Tortispora caseinolytica NRRL Y-17796]
MNIHTVVLCGPGHRLEPITTRGDSGVSKCLLPVAVEPMLMHVIRWLKEADISSVTLAVDPADYADVEDYAETTGMKNMFHCFSMFQTEASNVGDVIVDSLAGADHSADLMVLPCDFITDVRAVDLIDRFIRRSIDTMALTVWYESKFAAVSPFIPVHKEIVGARSEESRQILLDVQKNPLDPVVSPKAIELPMTLLWKYADPCLSTRLRHGCIALIARSALSVGDTELPSPNSSYDYQSRTPSVVDLRFKVNSGGLLSAMGPSFYGYEATGKPSIPMSTWRKHSWNAILRSLARNAWKSELPGYQVDMYVVPPTNTFIRVNSIPSYLEATRHLLRIKAATAATTASFVPSAGSSAGASQVPSHTGVSADSIADPSVIIEEKTTLKRSMIASNVSIGKRCRLIGCIVLQGATIEDGCHLESCVVGPMVTIGQKSRLTSCTIEGGFNIAPGTEAKNEVMQKFTNAMLDYHSESSSDDEDDENESEWEVSEGEDLDDDDGLFDRS